MALLTTNFAELELRSRAFLGLVDHVPILRPYAELSDNERRARKVQKLLVFGQLYGAKQWLELGVPRAKA